MRKKKIITDNQLLRFFILVRPIKIDVITTARQNPRIATERRQRNQKKRSVRPSFGGSFD